MYRVDYLPIAKRDLVEIARYVAFNLGNPTAAERLSVELVDSIESLSAMPYRRSAYTSIRPLAHEYRSLKVAGYLVLYWIEEEPEQTVVVARVVYGGSDVSKRLRESERPG